MISDEDLLAAFPLVFPVSTKTVVSDRVCLYVELCRDNHYYVGICGNSEAALAARHAQHTVGGCAWTELWHAEKTIYKQFDVDPTTHAEDGLTLKLMNEHGLLRVRGGKYSSRYLSVAQHKEIEASLVHSSGSCFRCEQGGHVAAQCPNVQSYRESFTRWSRPPPQPQSIPLQRTGSCVRCGRTGHLVGKCFARTTLTGAPLPRPHRKTTISSVSTVFPSTTPTPPPKPKETWSCIIC